MTRTAHAPSADRIDAHPGAPQEMLDEVAQFTAVFLTQSP